MMKRIAEQEKQELKEEYELRLQKEYRYTLTCYLIQ